MDQYLELREGMRRVRRQAAKTGPAAGPAERPGQPPRPGTRRPRSARPARTINRIDRQLGKLAQQEDKLHAQMATAGAKADVDFSGLAELNRKLQEIAEEKEGLELEWLEVSEILE